MSTVLNVFFTRAFAEHLQRPAPVIAASVNPGYCYSELRRNAPFTMQIRFKIMDWTMGRSAEGGARQLVWAALGPDGQDGPHVRHLQGAYVSNAEVFEPSDFVISKQGYEAQERLWVSYIVSASAALYAYDCLVRDRRYLEADCASGGEHCPDLLLIVLYPSCLITRIGCFYIYQIVVRLSLYTHL